MKSEKVGLIIFLILVFDTSIAVAADFVVKNGEKESTKLGEPIPVNESDVRILQRAAGILKDSSKWNRHDNRECPPNAIAYSLYCALWRASEEINGKFDHRLGALEEVRRSVEVALKGKAYEHRLMGYNNDPTTSFKDIKKVLDTTEKRIADRLRLKSL